MTLFELTRNLVERAELPEPLKMITAVGVSAEEVAHVTAKVMAQIHTEPIADAVEAIYGYLALGMVIGIAWQQRQEQQQQTQQTQVQAQVQAQSN